MLGTNCGSARSVRSLGIGFLLDSPVLLTPVSRSFLPLILIFVSDPILVISGAVYWSRVNRSWCQQYQQNLHKSSPMALLGSVSAFIVYMLHTSWHFSGCFSTSLVKSIFLPRCPGGTHNFHDVAYSLGSMRNVAVNWVGFFRVICVLLWIFFTLDLYVQRGYPHALDIFYCCDTPKLLHYWMLEKCICGPLQFEN